MTARCALLMVTLVGCNEVIYEQYPGDADDKDDVVFDSAWTTALGTTDDAVRDGGRWTSVEGSGASFEVTTGGPAATNFLKVPRHGAAEGNQSLHLLGFMPAGDSFYVRFYLGSDDATPSSTTVAAMRWLNPHAGITFVRRTATSSGWRHDLGIGDAFRTNGVDDVTAWWTPADASGNTLVPHAELYRFEYWIEYTSSTRVRVHPRVYDASGSLRWDDSHFRQQQYGVASWQGSNTWTLQRFYDAGFDFEIDPAAMNEISIGDGGSDSTSGAGSGWFFGAFQIRAAHWAGRQ